MALRYMARRVCTPVLQRALVPRAPPSAGSRPVCTRSPHPQGILFNDASKGKKQPEPMAKAFSKLTDEEMRQEVAKFLSLCKEASEGLEELARYQGIRRWLLLFSAGAGVGAGLAALAKITFGPKYIYY